MTDQSWKVWHLANDPATYGDNAGKPIITTEDGETEICGVVHDPKDAPILAASRDLLKALQTAWQRNANHEPMTFEECNTARAAIAKATECDAIIATA
jgi:hypothetical protein